jgi:hypothetical protein
MPALINSAPDCIVSNEAAEPADDSADFILQANFEDCAGFMTFGPGSTYGDEGAAAETTYYILTWLGIAFTLAALVAWVLYENRQLISHVARFRAGIPSTSAREPVESPTPQPGMQKENR